VVQTARKQIQGVPHYQFTDEIPPTLGVLPTEVCTNITNSLRDINKSANDAYQQLKALLVSRYTKSRWPRPFKSLKYPELGDMKPTNLMQQMKDSKPCTTFMAMFLLRLRDRDHLIAKDFKDCTLLADYADLLLRIFTAVFYQVSPARCSPSPTHSKGTPRHWRGCTEDTTAFQVAKALW